jgi:hypothetical protein
LYSQYDENDVKFHRYESKGTKCIFKNLEVGKEEKARTLRNKRQWIYRQNKKGGWVCDMSVIVYWF